MREIKFRVWNKDNKKMYYDAQNTYDYGCTNDNQIEENRFADLIQSGIWELMQYTGLKDKNGKEIYEGDIISNGYEKCIVVWIEEYAGFMLKLINKEYEDKEWTNPMIDLRKDEEVIGNIYNNPELLEKGN